MAKKRAYQTYYRDNKGELRVQLVDSETGQPVTDKSKYTVVDSTDTQGEELTGAPQSDATENSAKQGEKSSFKEYSSNYFRGQHGNSPKTSLGTNGESNNFGFISKPSWSKYASLVPGVGKFAAIANTAVNGINVNAINEARKHLGLEPMSLKDVVKGVVAGVDEGAVGDVKVGKKSYGVSLDDAVIDGKTQITAKEARERQNMESMQAKVAEHLTKNGFPAARSKLHPELDPMAEVSAKKGVTKGKGLASVTKGKPKGLPPGLEMVDGYRAKLASVDFDQFPDLDPATIEKAKAFQKEALARNLDLAVDVKDMVRTPERQKEIQAAGFSKTKKSEHMAGLGLDISPVDDQDQAGWAAKRDLAKEQGWGQLDPSWDPAHMGLTQSNQTPGPLDMTKEKAIEARNYFGNVPMSEKNKRALGIDASVPTPTDRPSTAPASYSDPAKAMSPKEQFYSEQYAYAKDAGLTGTAADIAVSQAAIESGYGTGQLASKNNNMHSMKAGQSWTGPTADYMDDETKPSSFRSYANPVDSYKDWAKVMETNFPDVLSAKNIDEANAALAHGRLGAYATAPDYASKLSKAYDEAKSFAPAPEVDPNASPFSKYSTGFYSALQKQPDPQSVSNKAREDTANRPGIAQMDNPMSPTAGMNPANPGASSTANFGRTDSPSSGNPSMGKTPGSSPSSSGFGKGPGAGMSSPGFGGGHTAPGSSPGSRASPSGSAGKSFGNSPSEGASHFGGSGLGAPSAPDKDKDKSQGPSGGGYGGWGGPH